MICRDIARMPLKSKAMESLAIWVDLCCSMHCQEFIDLFSDTL